MENIAKLRMMNEFGKCNLKWLEFEIDSFKTLASSANLFRKNMSEKCY